LGSSPGAAPRCQDNGGGLKAVSEAASEAMKAGHCIANVGKKQIHLLYELMMYRHQSLPALYRGLSFVRTFPTYNTANKTMRIARKRTSP
jgi:hypothetical protein